MQKKFEPRNINHEEQPLQGYGNIYFIPLKLNSEIVHMIGETSTSVPPSPVPISLVVQDTYRNSS